MVLDIIEILPSPTNPRKKLILFARKKNDILILLPIEKRNILK